MLGRAEPHKTERRTLTLLPFFPFICSLNTRQNPVLFNPISTLTVLYSVVTACFLSRLFGSLAGSLIGPGSRWICSLLFCSFFSMNAFGVDVSTVDGGWHQSIDIQLIRRGRENRPGDLDESLTSCFLFLFGRLMSLTVYMQFYILFHFCSPATVAKLSGMLRTKALLPILDCHSPFCDSGPTSRIYSFQSFLGDPARLL